MTTTPPPHLHKILREIGLTEKETTVYLASLGLGPQGISAMARHTGLGRTTLYDVFAGLVKRGLASTSNRGAVRYYQVLDPANLTRFLDRERDAYLQQHTRQRQIIERVIPELASLQNPLSTKPKVKIYEGEKALVQAYEDTLTATEPIRAWANVDEMHAGLPGFFPEYYQRRVEAGLFIYTISPDTPLGRARQARDPDEMREIRLIDSELYEFSPELNVYDDKVMIASWKETMALLIHSAEIADFHRRSFDLTWQLLGRFCN